MTISSRLVMAGCLLLSGTAMAFAPHSHPQINSVTKQKVQGQKVIRSAADRVISGANLVDDTLPRDAILDDYLKVIENYIVEHSELGFKFDDIVLNHDAVLIDKDVQFFKFNVYRDGLMIVDANVDFRFKRGKLVEVVNQSFSDAPSDERAVARNMFAMARQQFGNVNLAAAGKVYRVVEDQGAYRLIRTQRYEYENNRVPFMGAVEEATGRVYEAHPTVHYVNGVATAQVHPRYYVEPLVATPMGTLNLTDADSRATVVTDGNGLFTSQDNQKFGMDGYTGKQIRIAVAKGDPVKIAGSMQDGKWVIAAQKNGTAAAHEDAEIAQAMVYHHGNVVINYARRYIHTPWFDKTLLANVNISSTCNAYWNGTSVNFFSAGRSGNIQCANTGLISDVMYHEWGHGLDHNTGGIQDRAYSEGFGDIVSLLLTRSNILGIGFKLDGGFVRDLAPDKVYPKDKGEEHAEGLIIASTFYDLYLAMKEKMGDDAAINKLSEYAFKSIFTASKYTDVYKALLIIDDNDSNPGNGTPNLCTLNKVFTAHGLAKADPNCDLARLDQIKIDDKAGNNNGVIDPGERVKIRAVVSNMTQDTVTNLTATATLSGAEGLKLNNDTLNFGTLEPQKTVTSSNFLDLIVDDSAGCGMEFAINLEFKGSDRSTQIAKNLMVGKAIGKADTVKAEELPKDIPDTDSIAVVFDFEGEQWAPETKVRTARLRFSIEHSYLGDVNVKLVAPNGRSFMIVEGGSAQEEGTIRYDEDISALIGKIEGAGDWQLVVEDDSASDEGKLLTAELELTPEIVQCTK